MLTSSWHLNQVPVAAPWLVRAPIQRARPMIKTLYISKVLQNQVKGSNLSPESDQQCMLIIVQHVNQAPYLANCPF